MRMARHGLQAGMVLGALLLVGDYAVSAEQSDKKAEAVMLCTKCGEVAGAEKCCKPAASCKGCGLHKGSPGCCKIPKKMEGKQVALCGCGQVKGSEKCCAKDAKKCEACGMAAGSPGCKVKCAKH